MANKLDQTTVASYHINQHDQRHIEALLQQKDDQINKLAHALTEMKQEMSKLNEEKIHLCDAKYKAEYDLEGERAEYSALKQTVTE